MELFASLFKWQGLMIEDMGALIIYLATHGDEIETSARQLAADLSKVAGHTITKDKAARLAKMMEQGGWIEITAEGAGKFAKTVIRRGTGKGAARKQKEEFPYDDIQQWYNLHLVPLGFAPWRSWTPKLRDRVRKCQSLAKENSQTIGKVFKAIERDPDIVYRPKRSYSKIFYEDTFIDIINSINGYGQPTTDKTGTGTADRTQRDLDSFFTSEP